MTSARPASAWLLPLSEVVTVGLPFCVFKLLTGLVALETTGAKPLGMALLALGTCDAVVNAVNLLSLAFRGRRAMGICVLDVAWHSRGGGRPEDLGIALDVFLSFALVAVAIGAGWLGRLRPWALTSWNVAVILNVLGAGIGRLLTALRQHPNDGTSVRRRSP